MAPRRRPGMQYDFENEKRWIKCVRQDSDGLGEGEKRWWGGPVVMKSR